MYRRTSPFEDLFSVFRDFDNLFRRTFETWPAASAIDEQRLLGPEASAGEGRALTAPAGSMTPWRGWQAGIHPPVESFLRGDDLVVRAELPGVSPEDIEVQAEGRYLVVRGEKREEKRSGEGEPFLHEIVRGRFERSFLLPEGAEPERIKATCTDGVLEITCPAVSLAKATRRIPVETKSSGGKKDVKAA